MLIATMMMTDYNKIITVTDHDDDDDDDDTHDEVGLCLLHGGQVDDHDAVDHHNTADNAKT